MALLRFEAVEDPKLGRFFVEIYFPHDADRPLVTTAPRYSSAAAAEKRRHRDHLIIGKQLRTEKARRLSGLAKGQAQRRKRLCRCPAPTPDTSRRLVRLAGLSLDIEGSAIYIDLES